MNPLCTVTRKSNSKAVMAGLAKLGKKRVLIGIPEATADNRKSAILEMAGAIKGRTSTSIKRKAYLLKAAEQDVNNAELLYIFSKGSPLKGIPARPVIEPAIVDPGNKEAISAELAAAAKATLAGDADTATEHLKRAGMAGQRAAQGWFTNPANHWPPDAPSTIAAKGSAKPGIDTAAMRQAITFVVEED